jgi:hypothetical protein
MHNQHPNKHQSTSSNQSQTLSDEFNFCLSQLNREDGDMHNSKSAHHMEEG